MRSLVSRLTQAGMFLCAFSALAFAQSSVPGDRTFLGKVDASSATHTIPFKTGTSLPSTCQSSPPEWFQVQSGSTATLYYCYPANYWNTYAPTGGTASYINAAINGSGHLILTKTDGTTTDAGLAVGSAGTGITSVAINGSNHLIVTLTSGSTQDAGAIPTGPAGPAGATGAAGSTGAAGAAGVSVTAASINGSNHLIITLSNSTTVDAGALPSGSSGSSEPGVIVATNNGTGANDIAASIAACGTAVPCAVNIPATYTTSEAVPGFSIDPNNPLNCLTAGTIIVHDHRYGDGEQGCDFTGYTYSLQHTMHPWGYNFIAPEYPGEILNILNIIANYFDGGTNKQSATFNNKNTQSTSNFVVNDWTNGQLVNTDFYSRHFGLGDTLGIQFDSLCWQGGMFSIADEGCEAEDRHVYQGIGNNQWQEVSGTVTGSPTTGATSLPLNIVNGFRSQSVGGYLVDTSKSYSTGTLTSIAFSGGLHTFTFSGTSFPVSTAFGTLTSVVNSPGSASVSLSFSSGSISAISVGTAVCVSDGGSEELVKTTGVSSSGFTATFANSHYSGATFGVGGACSSYINPVADDITSSIWTSTHVQAIYGTLKTAFPVVYSDATHLYVHVAIAGGYGAFHSRLQSTNNAYFLYPGAQVLSVSGNGGLSTTLTLSPNTAAWAAGDSFMEIPFPADHYIFGNDTVESYRASIGNALHGNGFTLNQPLQGQDDIFKMVFSAPQSMYKMHGGAYTEPFGVILSGETSVGINLDPSSYSAIHVGCDSSIHGQIGACDGWESLMSVQGSGGIYDFGIDFSQNCYYVGGYGFTRMCLSTGTSSSTNATTIQGFAVSNATPTTGQALLWNGTAYAPSTVSSSGGGTNATTIQGQTVSSTLATNNQTLVFNSSSGAYVPTSISTVSAGNGVSTTTTGTVTKIATSLLPRPFGGTSENTASTDCSGEILFSNSSGATEYLGKINSAGAFPAGCAIKLFNVSSGTVTLQASSGDHLMTTTGSLVTSLNISAGAGFGITSDGLASGTWYPVP